MVLLLQDVYSGRPKGWLRGVEEVGPFSAFIFCWFQSGRSLHISEAPSRFAFMVGSKVWFRQICINVEWHTGPVSPLCVGVCTVRRSTYSNIATILGLMCRPLLKYQKPSTASARYPVPISLFVNYRECQLVNISSTIFHRESFKSRYLTKERTYSVVRGVNPSLVYHTPTTSLSS